MELKLSQHGEDLLAAREGEVLKVYRDSKGLPTMGVGHLLTATEKVRYPVGTKITKEFSRQLLAHDLLITETAIADLVTVPLSQNQYDALVSFIFNIGVKGFKTSTVLRKLNQKDYTGAGVAFLLWNKPPEIRKRRLAECLQFKTPYSDLAPDPAKAVSATDASDQKGGGGTQITPDSPPPIFSRERLATCWNTAMSGLDQLAAAKTKVSNLSFNTAVPAKGVGIVSVILSFFSSNKYELVVGLGLIALAVTILYVSYRRKSNDAR